MALRGEMNHTIMVPIGGSFLFGTFRDLIDLYYFKTMKAGNVMSRTRVNRVESPPSSEAPVQDNDVPVFPDNKVTHQDVPVPGKGDYEEFQQLFDRGTPTGAGSGPEARYSVAYLTLHEYLIRHPEVYERLRGAKIPEWGNVGMKYRMIQYYRLSVLDKLFQLESRQSALARDLVPVYGLAPDFINRVSEIASYTSQPDLNTQLRVVPIGGSFLFGTFRDLIDLYYFKTMKAGNVMSRTRVNRVESPPSSEAPVQDNDVPVFPDNKVTHQDVPVPGKGDCEEVQQLFDRGNDHFYPLARSLSVASDQFERPQRNHFRSIISRIDF
ncbi:hypothetical protein QR680_014303 [Steinernema hermaphroditum]|uniref:Uncharacterized protein n=1 Tax=Steinernema hermaphroditum TaxID=289476 RepID=A0AA39M3P4_9BILA|nr:hypothetical protein QR680_014303 [Steinernema hermaphroditum]